MGRKDNYLLCPVITLLFEDHQKKLENIIAIGIKRVVFFLEYGYNKCEVNTLYGTKNR
jgi:hypothetical protein